MTIFVSSRDLKNKKDSAEAIIKGLAEDGGLFTPTSFKSIDLEGLLSLSYQDMAIKILGTFFDDFDEEVVSKCVHGAYDTSFSAKEVIPVTHLKDASVVELYHGPTSAFKDVALTLLPRLLMASYKKKNMDKKIYILTATSGDTGKAALEGFKDVEDTYITVFYPKDGVAMVQEAQMVTTEGNNTQVIGIKGNFDDCQRLVKQCYEDKALLNDKVQLSSANSINIGRLAPQIVYYFSTYIQMVKDEKIKMGDKVTFVVPTGNFGDILAGYFAKQMGLPIDQLVCASNENNILTDFINTGVYDTHREFKLTMSPSMDILVSSNLERLLFILNGFDDQKTAAYMKDLKEKGVYKVDDTLLSKLQESFKGYYTCEEDCQKTIKEIFEKEGYLMDPHTSVAYTAAQLYKKENPDTPIAVLSTASPYKFCGNVLPCISDYEAKDEYDAMAKLYELSQQEIPYGLKYLQSKEVRHKAVMNLEEAAEAVKHKIEELAQ
ncbi:MAG: threonine synthase [Erysipelotrichaceae bacterium]|nr:threonine synthase [Erysipelotrichaceae bacterium]